jgi:hypothetical protein
MATHSPFEWRQACVKRLVRVVRELSVRAQVFLKFSGVPVFVFSIWPDGDPVHISVPIQFWQPLAQIHRVTNTIRHERVSACSETL